MSGGDVAFYVLGTLSMLGCIFNILITLLLKFHHIILGKMMLCLSTSDIFIIITLSALYLQLWQVIQFYDIIFFLAWTGSVSWICCFAHALHTSVKSGEECLNNSLLKKYICIALTISAMAGSLFAIFLITGSNPTFYKVLLFIMVMMVLTSIIYCAICYFSVFKKLQKYQGNVHLELFLYPLIMIICEFPLMIYILTFILKVDGLADFFYHFGILCLSSRGIWNSLAYGLSSKIRIGFKTLCKGKLREKNKDKLPEAYPSDLVYSDMPLDKGSFDAPNFVLK